MMNFTTKHTLGQLLGLTLSGSRALFRTAILTVIIGSALVGQCLCAQELSLTELSSTLRANEKLYAEDLDVVMTKRFETRHSEGPSVTNHGGMVYRKYKTLTEKIHYVYQNEKFFMQQAKDKTFFASDKEDEAHLPVQKKSQSFSQYNGKQTTFVQDASVANIFHFRNDLYKKNFPYRLFFEYSLLRQGDLSFLLLGYEYAAADPQVSKALPMKYVCKASEFQSAEGSNYVKVVFDFFKQEFQPDDYSQTDIFIREVFYLNEEKNYIPEKYEMYDARCGGLSKPAVVGKVLEWTEAKTGIWYPLRAELNNFVKPETPDDRSVHDQWFSQYQIAIEQCGLDPQYEDAYFSQIQIPDGTKVFEIETPTPKGEDVPVVTKTYRQGEPVEQKAGSQKSDSIFMRVLKRPLLLINVGVFLALVLSFGIRRKRASS